MRHLNGVYSQKMNRRHDRVGHVYQGRFKGVLVEKEACDMERPYSSRHSREYQTLITTGPLSARR